MVTAMVLLTVSRDKVDSIAKTLEDMEGISEVYSVSGRYDLVAVIRARNNEQVAKLVAGHMLKVDGIITSETLIAFKANSKHDLESIFAPGL